MYEKPYVNTRKLKVKETDITDEVLTLNSRYTKETFDVNPVTSCISTPGSAALGTTGSENALLFPNSAFEYHVLGTQTILAPVLAAGGLNIGMDQADNDGLELGQGITARSKGAFTVGTDAFFLKLTLLSTLANGTDLCVAGFRKAAAYEAAIATYTDFASIGIVGTAKKLQLYTDLNDAGEVTTDTTQLAVDATAFELGIFVSAGGVVTYTINGAAPTATAAFTFDDAEVVVPFLYVLQANAAQTGVLTLSSWECGLQKSL